MSYFFRQQVHFEKRDWDESKVTRGETVPGTNKGSFKSPGDAAAGAGSAALTAHSGRRKFRAAATDSALDNEVATSATPAQTMQAQFGPRMGEAEILTYLQRPDGPITPEQWRRYEVASAAAKQAQEAAGGDTEKQHATKTRTADGEEVIRYTDERIKAVQGPVVEKYVQEYFERAKANPSGEAELVVLAGRGGSGKSAFGYADDGSTGSFHLGFYSRSAVLLDPDQIKKDLYAQSVKSGAYPKDKAFDPEKSGAGYWHEESSHVTKVIQNRMLEMASRGYRADVVFDLTLASNKGTLMGRFRDAGFQTTLANMNIPPQNSAEQAVARFLKGGRDGAGGRLVPVGVIAKSKNNEANFDEMITMRSDKGFPVVGSWHIYTMREFGKPPALVASGGTRTKKGAR